MRQLLSRLGRAFWERLRPSQRGGDPYEKNVGEDVRPHWITSDEDEYNRSQKESERFNV